MQCEVGSNSIPVELSNDLALMAGDIINFRVKFGDDVGFVMPSPDDGTIAEECAEVALIASVTPTQSSQFLVVPVAVLDDATVEYMRNTQNYTDSSGTMTVPRLVSTVQLVHMQSGRLLGHKGCENNTVSCKSMKPVLLPQTLGKPCTTGLVDYHTVWDLDVHDVPEAAHGNLLNVYENKPLAPQANLAQYPYPVLADLGPTPTRPGFVPFSLNTKTNSHKPLLGDSLTELSLQSSLTRPLLIFSEPTQSDTLTASFIKTTEDAIQKIKRDISLVSEQKKPTSYQKRSRRDNSQEPSSSTTRSVQTMKAPSSSSHKTKLDKDKNDQHNPTTLPNLPSPQAIIGPDTNAILSRDFVKGDEVLSPLSNHTPPPHPAVDSSFFSLQTSQQGSPPDKVYQTRNDRLKQSRVEEISQNNHSSGVNNPDKHVNDIKTDKNVVKTPVYQPTAPLPHDRRHTPSHKDSIPPNPPNNSTKPSSPYDKHHMDNAPPSMQSNAWESWNYVEKEKQQRSYYYNSLQYKKDILLHEKRLYGYIFNQDDLIQTAVDDDNDKNNANKNILKSTNQSPLGALGPLSAMLSSQSSNDSPMMSALSSLGPLGSLVGNGPGILSGFAPKLDNITTEPPVDNLFDHTFFEEYYLQAIYIPYTAREEVMCESHNEDSNEEDTSNNQDSICLDPEHTMWIPYSDYSLSSSDSNRTLTSLPPFSPLDLFTLSSPVFFPDISDLLGHIVYDTCMDTDTVTLPCTQCLNYAYEASSSQFQLNPLEEYSPFDLWRSVVPALNGMSFDNSKLPSNGETSSTTNSSSENKTGITTKEGGIEDNGGGFFKALWSNIGSGSADGDIVESGQTAPPNLDNFNDITRENDSIPPSKHWICNTDIIDTKDNINICALHDIHIADITILDIYYKNEQYINNHVNNMVNDVYNKPNNNHTTVPHNMKQQPSQKEIIEAKMGLYHSFYAKMTRINTMPFSSFFTLHTKPGTRKHNETDTKATPSPESISPVLLPSLDQTSLLPPVLRLNKAQMAILLQHVLGIYITKHAGLDILGLETLPRLVYMWANTSNEIRQQLQHTYETALRQLSLSNDILNKYLNVTKDTFDTFISADIINSQMSHRHPSPDQALWSILVNSMITNDYYAFKHSNTSVHNNIMIDGQDKTKICLERQEQVQHKYLILSTFAQTGQSIGPISNNSNTNTDATNTNPLTSLLGTMLPGFTPMIGAALNQKPTDSSSSSKSDNLQSAASNFSLPSMVLGMFNNKNDNPGVDKTSGPSDNNTIPLWDTARKKDAHKRLSRLSQLRNSQQKSQPKDKDKDTSLLGNMREKRAVMQESIDKQLTDTFVHRSALSYKPSSSSSSRIVITSNDDDDLLQDWSPQSSYWHASTFQSSLIDNSSPSGTDWAKIGNVVMNSEQLSSLWSGVLTGDDNVINQFTNSGATPSLLGSLSLEESAKMAAKQAQQVIADIDMAREGIASTNDNIIRQFQQDVMNTQAANILGANLASSSQLASANSASRSSNETTAFISLRSRPIGHGPVELIQPCQGFLTNSLGSTVGNSVVSPSARDDYYWGGPIVPPPSGSTGAGGTGGPVIPPPGAPSSPYFAGPPQIGLPGIPPIGNIVPPSATATVFSSHGLKGVDDDEFDQLGEIRPRQKTGIWGNISDWLWGTNPGHVSNTLSSSYTPNEHYKAFKSLELSKIRKPSIPTMTTTTTTTSPAYFTPQHDSTWQSGPVYNATVIQYKIPRRLLSNNTHTFTLSSLFPVDKSKSTPVPTPNQLIGMTQAVLGGGVFQMVDLVPRNKTQPGDPEDSTDEPWPPRPWPPKPWVPPFPPFPPLLPPLPPFPPLLPPLPPFPGLPPWPINVNTTDSTIVISLPPLPPFPPWSNQPWIVPKITIPIPPRIEPPSISIPGILELTLPDLSIPPFPILPPIPFITLPITPPKPYIPSLPSLPFFPFSTETNESLKKYIVPKSTMGLGSRKQTTFSLNRPANSDDDDEYEIITFINTQLTNFRPTEGPSSTHNTLSLGSTSIQHHTREDTTTIPPPKTHHYGAVASSRKPLSLIQRHKRDVLYGMTPSALEKRDNKIRAHRHAVETFHDHKNTDSLNSNNINTFSISNNNNTKNQSRQPHIYLSQHIKNIFSTIKDYTVDPISRLFSKSSQPSIPWSISSQPLSPAALTQSYNNRGAYLPPPPPSLFPKSQKQNTLSFSSPAGSSSPGLHTDGSYTIRNDQFDNNSNLSPSTPAYTHKPIITKSGSLPSHYLTKSTTVKEKAYNWNELSKRMEYVQNASNYQYDTTSMDDSVDVIEFNGAMRRDTTMSSGSGKKQTQAKFIDHNDYATFLAPYQVLASKSQPRVSETDDGLSPAPIENDTSVLQPRISPKLIHKHKPVGNQYTTMAYDRFGAVISQPSSNSNNNKPKQSSNTKHNMATFGHTTFKKDKTIVHSGITVQTHSIIGTPDDINTLLNNKFSIFQAGLTPDPTAPVSLTSPCTLVAQPNGEIECLPTTSSCPTPVALESNSMWALSRVPFSDVPTSSLFLAETMTNLNYDMDYASVNTYPFVIGQLCLRNFSPFEQFVSGKAAKRMFNTFIFRWSVGLKPIIGVTFDSLPRLLLQPLNALLGALIVPLNQLLAQIIPGFQIPTPDITGIPLIDFSTFGFTIPMSWQGAHTHTEDTEVVVAYSITTPPQTQLIGKALAMIGRSSIPFTMEVGRRVHLPPGVFGQTTGQVVQYQYSVPGTYESANLVNTEYLVDVL